MFNKKLLPIILTLILGTSSAWAQDNEQEEQKGEKNLAHHELLVGSDSTFSFSDDNSSFGIDLGYYYLMWPELQIQVGITTELSYTSVSDMDTTVWTNILNARYNLDNEENSNLNEHFFVELGIGLRYADAPGMGSDSDFVYEGGFGQRIPLRDNLSMTPSLSIRKVEDDEAQFNLTLLAFSLFF